MFTRRAPLHRGKIKFWRLWLLVLRQRRGSRNLFGEWGGLAVRSQQAIQDFSAPRLVAIKSSIPTAISTPKLFYPDNHVLTYTPLFIGCAQIIAPYIMPDRFGIELVEFRGK